MEIVIIWQDLSSYIIESFKLDTTSLL